MTLRFQPSNMGSFFPDSAAAVAFAEDRANFAQGSTLRRIPLEEAQPRYHLFLAELEAQLSDGRAWLFGGDWTIADFSTYHVLWFVHAGGRHGRFVVGPSGDEGVVSAHAGVRWPPRHGHERPRRPDRGPQRHPPRR